MVKKGGITLCTDNFILSDVNKIKETMDKKFEISCSIHNKKGRSGKIYHKVYIKKDDFNNKIRPLIINHVHKYFLYKLK